MSDGRRSRRLSHSSSQQSGQPSGSRAPSIPGDRITRSTTIALRTAANSLPDNGLANRANSVIPANFLRQQGLADYIAQNPGLTMRQMIEYIRSVPNRQDRGDMQLDLLNSIHRAVQPAVESVREVLEFVENDQSYRSATADFRLQPHITLEDSYMELYAIKEGSKRVRNRKEEEWKSAVNLMPELANYTLLRNILTSAAGSMHFARMIREAKSSRTRVTWSMIAQRINLFTLFRLSRSSRGVSNARVIQTTDLAAASNMENPEPKPPNNWTIAQWAGQFHMAFDQMSGLVFQPANAPEIRSNGPATPSSTMVVLTTDRPPNAEDIPYYSDASRRSSVASSPRPTSAVYTPTQRPSGMQQSLSDPSLVQSISNLSITSGPRDPDSFEVKTLCSNPKCAHPDRWSNLLNFLNNGPTEWDWEKKCLYLHLFRTSCNQPHLLCRHHLRSFGGKLGLLVRGDSATICTRINQMVSTICVQKQPANKTDVQRYRAFAINRLYWTWFRDSGRDFVEADLLGVNRFFPVNQEPYRCATTEQIKIMAKIINLDRKKHYDKFVRDGSLNFDIMPWFRSEGILYKAKVEYNMYKWHLRKPNQRNDNQGWNRTMFFSLFQQVMRQDPAYRMLYVICRKDSLMQLCTSPYYTKYQVKDDNTKFTHIDVGPRELVRNGRGQFAVQGSVSIDAEKDDDCTIMVKGMHKKEILKEWVEWMESRNLVGSEVVKKIDDTNLPKAFLQKHNLKWTHEPCPEGYARITDPGLPHGALGPAKRVRRTYLPWYVGLNSDHQRFEQPEGPSWEEISQAHRDLMPPAKTPSGFGFNFGKVTTRFPGSFPLRIQNPLCEALIAQRKWTDPSVKYAIDEFLSTNDSDLSEEEKIKIGRDHMKWIHEEIWATYRSTWQDMVEQEMESFPGKKSFFRVHPELQDFDKINRKNCDLIRIAEQPAPDMTKEDNTATTSTPEDLLEQGLPADPTSLGHD